MFHWLHMVEYNICNIFLCLLRYSIILILKLDCKTGFYYLSINFLCFWTWEFKHTLFLLLLLIRHHLIYYLLQYVMCNMCNNFLVFHFYFDWNFITLNTFLETVLVIIIKHKNINKHLWVCEKKKNKKYCITINKFLHINFSLFRLFAHKTPPSSHQ